MLKELDGDVFVRSLAILEGTLNVLLVEASDIDADGLKELLESQLGISLNDENYFVEETGSKLGEDFYKQMVSAVLIAFLLMALTILIIFRKIIPSVIVVLSALLDIIVTVAVIDLLGIRINAAGIAALLLLIGYSVDTDVLLLTKLIKSTEGSVWERIVSSAKTGLTMTVTTLSAMMVGFIFSSSLILKQMFLIIFIGLVVDVISTYLMNAGLLKWYLERKNG